MNTVPKTIGFISVFFLLTGFSCTNSRLNIKPISLNEDPIRQLTQLETKLDQAREKKVDVLSPIWFSKAEESYWEAKNLHSEGGELKEILGRLSLGQAQLARAKELAPVAKIVIGDVIEARQDAIQAGANEKTDGFTKAEDLFLDITQAIEDGNREKAEARSEEVEKSYRAVELAAIKDGALTPARNTIRQAREKDAEKYAPQSLVDAERTLETATAFIENNREDDTGILMQASQALFMAQRSYNLTQQAKVIKEDAPEKTALRMEQTRRDLTNWLEIPDMRDLKFEEQMREVKASIESLQKTKQKLLDKSINLEAEVSRIKEAQQQQVARLSEEKREKELEVAQLEEDKAFHEKFERVRKEFLPSEADVYKEGKRLVIRLKGIHFPSGKAVLLSGNYPLLSKVQKAISQFENPKVIVEGHTDSIGSERVNQIISMARAKEVQNYLISNNKDISENQVNAIGYGYSKPITTNRTKEGRTKNRRIDVIIEPEGKSAIN